MPRPPGSDPARRRDANSGQTEPSEFGLDLLRPPHLEQRQAAVSGRQALAFGLERGEGVRPPARRRWRCQAGQRRTPPERQRRTPPDRLRLEPQRRQGLRPRPRPGGRAEARRSAVTIAKPVPAARVATASPSGRSPRPSSGAVSPVAEPARSGIPTTPRHRPRGARR